MGGRGASYGRSTVQQLNPVSAQLQPAMPAPPPPDDTEEEEDVQMAPPPLGTTQDDLAKMTDDELHDFLIGVQNTDMPDFLPDGHLQRMIYSMGLNGKPEVVDPATLKQMVQNGGTAIYRTVNDTDVSGVPMPSKQVAEDFTDGDLAVMGGGGARAYGDGLYFSDSHSGSRGGYGGRNAYTIGGVLNSNARVVTGSQLQREYRQFITNHPRTQRALGFASAHGNGGSRTMSIGQFALIRGYNVISNDVYGGEHYYVVLDRSALTVAKRNYTRPI